MKKNLLASYCFFTYNQESYVEESLQAALKQTYTPLEIIISDDCSTDKTVAIINKVLAAYTGGHRIILNVNRQNMGIGGHVSKVLLELCSGEYFVQVGGDDISSPNHVKIAMDSIEANRHVHAVDFSASVIDAEGGILDADNSPKRSLNYCLEDFISMKKPINSFAPGRIIHKDIMNKFPPISSSCPTEDSVQILRALILGGLKREPINLIKYRRTDNSVSNPTNIKKLSVKGIIDQYNADTDAALASGLINKEQAQHLKRRIAFEHFKRQMFMQNNVGRIVTFLLKIKFKILKLFYQLGR